MKQHLLKITYFLIWLGSSWAFLKFGVVSAIFSWWQDNAIETAYQGPDILVATGWWGIPAIAMQPVVSIIPIIIIGIALIYVYHLTNTKSQNRW